MGPGATSERELAWFDWSIVNDISADGKTVLLSEEGEAGGFNYLIYMRNTDGSSRCQNSVWTEPRLYFGNNCSLPAPK